MLPDDLNIDLNKLLPGLFFGWPGQLMEALKHKATSGCAGGFSFLSFFF